jgi:serine/threonine-protein kinase
MLVCPKCGWTPGPELATECPRDQRLLVPLADYKLAPTDRYLGTRLAGKYPLVGILGIGGMATVYRAIQEPVGREVAVKVVSPEADDNNAVRERFEREARVIARLQHPNIVTLYDFGVEPDGTLFMVQELVEGRPLSVEIKEHGPLPLDRALRIALQAVAALSEAHSKHLVHRDMKPENIMLMPTSWGGEQVKVLDFGIARLLSRVAGRQERLTKAGMIFGTPHYMSPEQVAGSTEIGFPSDVYSTAIVLWEMLTGQAPFAASSLVDVLVSHRLAPLPALPARLRVPAPIEEVLRRAAAKDPRERYAHAAELLRALESAMGASALSTLPPSPSTGAEPTASLPVIPRPISDKDKTKPAATPPRRAEARGTLVMAEAPAPAPAEPRASWARIPAAGNLHSRPTLLVAADGELGGPVGRDARGLRRGEDDEGGETSELHPASAAATVAEALDGRLDDRTELDEDEDALEQSAPARTAPDEWSDPRPPYPGPQPLTPPPEDLLMEAVNATAATVVLPTEALLNPPANVPSPSAASLSSLPARPDPPRSTGGLVPWILLGIGLTTLVLALALAVFFLQAA